MASRPPVRLSHRRGSIGAAILLAVSLSLLGAQAVSEAHSQDVGPPASKASAGQS